MLEMRSPARPKTDWIAEKQVLKMPAMISKREEKRLEMPDVKEDMAGWSLGWLLRGISGCVCGGVCVCVCVCMGMVSRKVKAGVLFTSSRGTPDFLV